MGMALASGRITRADYELINAYLLELRVEKGIGVLRMDKLAGLATCSRLYVGEYETNTLEDIHNGILAEQVA